MVLSPFPQSAGPSSDVENTEPPPAKQIKLEGDTATVGEGTEDEIPELENAKENGETVR